MKFTVFDKKVFMIEDKSKNAQSIMRIAEDLVATLHFNRDTFENEFPHTKDGFFYIPHKALAEHFEVSMYVIRKTIELLEFLGILVTKKVGTPGRNYVSIAIDVIEQIEEAYSEDE